MRTSQRQVTLNNISLGSNLSKVRNKLNQLSKSTSTFTDPITIIALQQGIGKTNMFIEYAKNHWKKEKIILASPRHNHLNEIYSKLGDIKAKHWYGFSYKDDYGIYRGCSKLNQNIKFLNNLKTSENENLLNPKYICEILGCKKNKCRYHITHNKSSKIDLIPLEYLGTDAIINQKPKIIFIDESIDKIETYTYDDRVIIKCIMVSIAYGYSQLETNLQSIIPKPKHGKITSTIISNIQNDANDLIEYCIKIGEYAGAKIVNQIHSILKYLLYAPSYKSDNYHRPKIYDAFDLACKYEIKLVFLNASFSDNLFTYFLETYPNNIGNLNIPKYTSNIINKESILIRVYPEDKFWKEGFATYNIQRTLKKIFQVLNKTEKYIPKEKIGIITYLTSGPRYGNINIENKFAQVGYDTVHFWDESGLNILENKYVLIVIGTPFIPTKEVIDIWEKIHDEKTELKEEDIGHTINDEYNISDRLEILEYEDWEVADYLWTLQAIDDILDKWGYYKPGYKWHHDVFMKFFNKDHTKKYDFTSVKRQYIDQMIDSIHRCRPLTHDRIIIALGDVLAEYPWIAWESLRSPYKIINFINYLLKIKQLEANNLNELEDIIKKHNIVTKIKVRKLLDFVLDNEGYISKSSIASSLKLWNKGNPDVTFIKEITKIIEEIEQKV